mmetsp:Transcript_5096/g.9347  ORF Transcript_5096/g.9347 Transcript_5096/m.9347 type:complete len:373 (+) Transcript_5096:53-1171(+)
MTQKLRKTSKIGLSLPLKILITLSVFVMADVLISKYLIVDEKVELKEDKDTGAKSNRFSNRDLLAVDDEDNEITNTTAKIDFESKHAIALISFGKEASESTLLERCILSIRRRGDFDGHVVVITDAPESRYVGEFDEKVIVLQADEDDILYDAFKAPAMKYKRFKTLLIQYIDSVPELDAVEWLYYMDIDMMLGDSFIDAAQALHSKYNIEDDRTGVSSLYMFKDPNANLYALNTGFIIMSRHFSSRCLDLWKDRFDADRLSHNDQKAVNQVIRYNNGTNYCNMMGMDAEKYLTYPRNDEALIEIMLEGEYSPFIHVFNTCFAKRVSQKTMELFVGNVLQLSDEEKREHKFGKAFISPSSSKWTDTDETLAE